MKKIIFAGALLLSCSFSQTTQAQSILSNLLSGVTNAAVQSTAASTSKNQTASETKKEVAGSVLNSVVSSTAGTSAGNLLSNLIAAVSGDVTTTSTSIVGNWTYAAPSVQFESENYLTQAGGAAVAEKVESKLASLYKLVGIKPGKFTFVFDNKGNVTYGIGALTRTGTYTFDSASKTIVITTQAGANIKSYVTVSGDQMFLTFDGSKLFSLMKTLGSRFNALSTITTIADSYSGMKVGFSFTRG